MIDSNCFDATDQGKELEADPEYDEELEDA
jgi:hypothetical protein